MITMIKITKIDTGNLNCYTALGLFDCVFFAVKYKIGPVKCLAAGGLVPDKSPASQQLPPLDSNGNYLVSNSSMSTRDVILRTIKEQPRANVDALAGEANVSPVTVRHHLNALQADGLIESDSVRRKVGRPYYVYSLSEKGQELFPKRYVRLTSRLLDELKNQLPPQAFNDVLSSVVDSVLEDHRGEYEHLHVEERLDYLIELLADEGFLARWERTGDGYVVTEFSCPYITLGEDHVEICNIDKELIVNVLGAPVQQNSCMLDGGECCQFLVKIEETEVSQMVVEG
jgi:DeoR family suf operon transcriptional repressor